MTTVIDRTVTVDSVCQAVKPILVSHSDTLSKDTAEQIGDHNNALRCACPSLRPQGFDVAVCAMP